MQTPVTMKMKTRLATLLAIISTTGPLLSATEVERLRTLCAEQEMQIRQLETKIARLTDTPPPVRNSLSATAGSARNFEPVDQQAAYTVKSGDSIERIARKTGFSVASINKANGLKSTSIIHPGQSLKLPGSTSSAATAPGNTPPAMDVQTHTVQSGDTFYRISTKYGVPVDALIAANPGINHRALRIGQKVNVSVAKNEIARMPAPAPEPAPSFSSAPSTTVSNSSAPIRKPRASDRPVRIEKEVTYAQFAQNHSTTTGRLNELNGLELDPSTVLAQGSELYIPAQP